MRRRRAPERKILPDPKYKSELVSKFINGLMLKGEKSQAEKIFYTAMDIIEDKLKKDPLEVFKAAMENVAPILEVRSRRVGGATYQKEPWQSVWQMNLWQLSKMKARLLRKKKIRIKWQKQIRLLLISDGKKRFN
jgi:hypothetical protein